MYWVRFLAITYVSQYLIDLFVRGNFREEHWHPAVYTMPPSISVSINDPFTLAFHKGVIQHVTEGHEDTFATTLDNKPLNVV